MIKPVPIESFGGSATRWPAEKLPPHYCRTAKNIQFLGNGVKSRDGSTSAFSGPSLTARVTGLGQFTLADRTHVPIAFDSDGNLFKESPSGGGGTELITAGIGSDLSMEGESIQDRFYATFSNLQTSGLVPKVYHKTADDVFYLDEIALAPNATPAGAAPVSESLGDVPVGNRYCLVLFKTRTGYISGATDAAILFVGVPIANRMVSIVDIPLGPANCVARVLAFTEAGASSAGPYFVIEQDDVLSELNNPNITATIVQDNITTTAEFNFTDDYLVGALDVTNYFNKMQPASAVGVYFSPTLARMILVGEDKSTFRVSEPNDVETFFATTGYIIPADGADQRAITAREWRSELYLLKERSGHLVADSTTDPSSWKTLQKWDKVGPWGVRAVDTCDEFMIIAGPMGAYKWDGLSMSWISYEVSGDKDNGELSWDRINQNQGHKIWVTIDPTVKEIYFGVPLDESTEVSHVFVCNYADGWRNRKWSYWTLPFTVFKRLHRTLASSPNPNVSLPNTMKASQLCGASSDPNGQVVMMDSTATSDSGSGFLAEWVTRYEPPPSYGTVYQITGVDILVRGLGQLTTDLGMVDGVFKPLRMVDLVADKYVDHALRPSGQNERFSFRFTNNGDPGNWFSIQRVTAYMGPIWVRRSV